MRWFGQLFQFCCPALHHRVRRRKPFFLLGDDPNPFYCSRTDWTASSADPIPTTDRFVFPLLIANSAQPECRELPFVRFYAAQYPTSMSGSWPTVNSQFTPLGSVKNSLAPTLNS